MEQVIDNNIKNEVLAKLDELSKQHKITIISAIESGSRSWGFPSPDSDYDVRFVYMHKPEWYIQLNPERDVIEMPISDELDIAGWDVRKAMNLANNGNSVIQEWMISPLVYQENEELAIKLREMIASTFNAKATYHHYSSMAKNMIAVLDEPDIKLKKFFYISRATLSALWVVREQSMPTTVFSHLLSGLTDDVAVIEAFEGMIREKGSKTEAESGVVNRVCLEFVRNAFEEIVETEIEHLPPRKNALSNDHLRMFLGELSGLQKSQVVV